MQDDFDITALVASLQNLSNQYIPRADLNSDGVHDAVDLTIFQDAYTANESGVGVLSATDLSGFSYGDATYERKNLDNRIGFGGYMWDPWLGAYHVRHRVYDPNLRRWLQVDPIGYAGGDWDLSRYCNGDPVNFVDPMGLSGQPTLDPLGRPVVDPDARDRNLDPLRDFERSRQEGMESINRGAIIGQRIGEIVQDFSPGVGAMKDFAEGNYAWGIIGFTTGPIGKALGKVFDLGKGILKGTDKATDATEVLTKHADELGDGAKGTGKGTNAAENAGGAGSGAKQADSCDSPSKAVPNRGNLIGEQRARDAADSVGGKVQKPNDTIIEGKHGNTTDVDVLGPNGEYYNVGGPGKANDHVGLGQELSILLHQRSLGKTVGYILTTDTPQATIDFVVKRMGADSVRFIPPTVLP